MTNYLGIDYGLSKVGLAIAQTTLATPLKTLPHDDRLLPTLLEIIKEHTITKIVCGLPEGKLVPQIKHFAQLLGDTSGVPVILHEETLTTHDSLQKLREIKAKRSKLQDNHVYAACLILEDYLELENAVY